MGMDLMNIRPSIILYRNGISRLVPDTKHLDRYVEYIKTTLEEQGMRVLILTQSMSGNSAYNLGRANRKNYTFAPYEEWNEYIR